MTMENVHVGLNFQWERKIKPMGVGGFHFHPYFPPRQSFPMPRLDLPNMENQKISHSQAPFRINEL